MTDEFDIAQEAELEVEAGAELEAETELFQRALGR